MKTNRRRFLAAAGATASATLLAPSLFDFKLLAGSPFVRPDVAGLSNTDPIILGYQTAFTNMNALLPSDVRSWTYQAAIHYTTSLASNVAWDSCQHGTHLFWAWHRMYLYWWERIVRKYSGDSSWVLPYWNWTANRTLPPMFQITTSNLYTTHRDSHINNGTGSLPPADVDYSAGFAELNYYDAQSSVEILPHDQVHVDIGGWMASVPTAALGPHLLSSSCQHRPAVGPVAGSRRRPERSYSRCHLDRRNVHLLRRKREYRDHDPLRCAECSVAAELHL